MNQVQTVYNYPPPDREGPVVVSGGQGVSTDRLAVLLATHHLHLSPPAIPLFAFKQVRINLSVVNEILCIIDILTF